jgi:hypothetical protein
MIVIMIATLAMLSVFVREKDSAAQLELQLLTQVLAPVIMLSCRVSKLDV